MLAALPRPLPSPVRTRAPANLDLDACPIPPQVGHLLGLGDRHLDNMLLHQRGGHLVHIDFSVIFDRCATPLPPPPCLLCLAPRLLPCALPAVRHFYLHVDGARSDTCA